jgi:hypothetical protein
MFIASVSRFSGGIVNSGTISGAGAGIQLESIKTFAGGVSNTGTIAGTIGIDVLNMQGLSIFDAGAIIGSGGTAIELAGSGNTLTLGAGYVISGVVDPLSGSNTFQRRHRLGYVRPQLHRRDCAVPGLYYLQRGRRRLDGHQREQRPLDHQKRRHR